MNPDTAPESTEGRPPPQARPLWQVLEEEFTTVHGVEFRLDEAYRRRRDAAIAQARAQVQAKVEAKFRSPAGAPGRTISSTKLAAEVEKVIQHQPDLIDGPVCQELFQRIHHFVEGRAGIA